eukprot:jgi/Hompol1/996/HPOL_001171-RA
MINQPTPTTPLFPCSTSQVFVNVSVSRSGNGVKDVDIASACAAKLGVATSFSVTQAFVKLCLTVPTVLTRTEPEFMVFYAVIMIETLILMIYQIHREFLSLSSGYSADSNRQTTLFDESGIHQHTKRRSKRSGLRFTGYSHSYFGLFVKSTLYFVSAFWFIFMGIVIADYYEVFSGYSSRNSALIFGDHESLSMIFIGLWHLMAVWFVMLQINSTWLQTYFAVRAPLAAASHVLIEKDIAMAVKFKNLGWMVEQVQRIEKVLRRLTKTDRSTKMTSVKYTNTGRRYIEFECVRYVFDQATGSFEPFHFPIGPSCAQLLEQASGLSSTEAELRYELAGPNEIVFKVDSFSQGIIKEFTGLFYIYQLMMLLIWYYYAYYYMGIVLTAVIVGSGIVKVLVATDAQRRVLQMATFHGSARVLRDGVWSSVDCSSLMPGDVIEIEVSDRELSVDCVIVKGEVVADESSLTGEALPVAKFAVKKDGAIYNRDEAGKINALYAGCHILETRPDIPHEPVTAIVLATGASTAKGRLVRDILYPMPVSFVFLEHLKIVLPLLIMWGVVMLALSMFMLGTLNSDAWFYGMFTISQVLSPLLPAVLVIGQSISAERLRERGIMCVDLSRITLAGKVSVFCFDKTGTLTKEGLDFLGTHPINEVTARFGDLETNFLSFTATLKQAMHCCHSLSTVGDQYVGNFVDIEMFRATGAQLDNRGTTATVVPSSMAGVEEIKIIKRFEFVHSHAYMSVVAQETRSGKIIVFLKGSYEKLRDLVDQTSLPTDFDQVAKSHSANGCYVLAIAKRELPASTTIPDIHAWSREQIEYGARMSGLMLFRNELKPDTELALTQLRNGGCRVVMITGDHANTGIHIARTCGMIRKDPLQGLEPVVCLADLDKQRNVVWTFADEDRVVPHSEVLQHIEKSRNGLRSVELAVTGKAFNTSSAPIATSTPHSTWPSKVFAPYVYLEPWSTTFDLQTMMSQTGVRHFVFAFVLASTSGDPVAQWDGQTPLTDPWYLSKIAQVRSAGGDVIIGFGGAAGNELATQISNATLLLQRYEEAITTLNITWIDFDIEGATLMDSVSVDRRNNVIYQLQKLYPHLRVSFTLPVATYGLVDDGIAMLVSAKKAGVRLDVLNIMTMDYYILNDPNGGTAMGSYAISAATAAKAQLLANQYPTTQIGVTPMIGVNDDVTEIFTLDNAKQLVQFAQSTDWVAWLSFWSGDRDSQAFTRVPQSVFGFTQIFKAFGAA